MCEDEVEIAKSIFEVANESLKNYYNKPYNYNKLVSLMNSDFGKMLDISFIAKIFKAKQALHKIEKQFTFDDIALEMANSRMVIEEYRLEKQYRMEAIKAGVESESGIRAHIDFKMTDFNSGYEEFSSYKNSIDFIKNFFHKESRNVEGILSQGKSLSYSGYKYNDETGLHGYE